MNQSKLIILLIISTLFCWGVKSEQGFTLDFISSSLITPTQMQCLSLSYSKIIIQAYEGTRGLNVDAVQAAQMAIKYGLQVDFFSFMCNTCSNNTGTYDMTELVDTLKAVEYGTLWVDIGFCYECWNSSLPINADYVNEIVNVGRDANVNMGIYTSEEAYTNLIGTTDIFDFLPLWYIGSMSPSFNDPSNYQFSGWTYPTMKQYSQKEITQCSVEIGLTYYQQSSSNSN